jgi:hypothetical protein
MRHDWARSLESAMVHGFGTGYGYDNVACYIPQRFHRYFVFYFTTKGGDR